MFNNCFENGTLILESLEPIPPLIFRGPADDVRNDFYNNCYNNIMISPGGDDDCCEKENYS